jgi:hypothetical protein
MTYVQQRIITRGPGIQKTFPYARCPQYLTDRIPPFSFCAQQERLTTLSNNTSSFIDYVSLDVNLSAQYYQYEFFADVEALAGEVISIRLVLDKGQPSEEIIFQQQASNLVSALNLSMFKSALATEGDHTFTLDFASLGTSTVSVHTGYILVINYSEMIII